MVEMKNEEKKDVTKCYWQHPPKGWIKVNVDGSFMQETENGSTGVVIRDHMGHTIMASGSILPRCSNAEEAEALTLLEGCRLAKNWTRQPIIFESDCMTLVKAIQQKNDSRSRLRSIFSDFFHCSSDLPGWECVFVKRQQNNAAHACAEYVRRIGSGTLWNNMFPDQISRALNYDCNHETVYVD
jgi:ribonuclease HI